MNNLSSGKKERSTNKRRSREAQGKWMKDEIVRDVQKTEIPIE